MPAGLQEAQGDSALVLTAQGAATVKSGPIAQAGAAAYVLVGVHCTAITGTTPTLDVSLDESVDGTTWTALGQSSTPQITAAGNAVAFAVPAKNFVRVSATVAGTTPSVTAKIAVFTFAE
jgi:hypothetical protein